MLYIGKTPETEQYGVKWSIGNQAGVVAACVYQKMLAPLYADELLALVLEKFVEMFGKKINDATGTADAFCKEFDAVYDAILRTLEKPVKSKRKPRSFAEAKAKKDGGTTRAQKAREGA